MRAIKDFFGDLKVLWKGVVAKPPAADAIMSFALLAESNAAQFPDAPALLCEAEVETWKGLNRRANRIANLLKSQGIVKGDCISLFMQNRIEFVVQALAICKLGAVASLINTNLNRQQLVHCISLTHSKKCIFGAELAETLNEVRAELSLQDGADYLWVKDKMPEPAPDWSVSLDSKDQTLNQQNPPDTKQVELGNKAFFIFTSGTTGLPKAAVVSHKRLLPTADVAASMLLRIKQSDRMYNSLPLYHGTGLMAGLTAAFVAGASTVIRRRLSVSAFWSDIKKYDCTCFVYIGELLRYLLSQPASPSDKHNTIRAIVGNGLRPDIWMAFKERFGIERIGEFYGASEGNGGFANVLNKDCTVGLGTAPCKIAAWDVAQDELIKDAQGYCIEQPRGESGLLLIEITAKSEFEGYTNPEASEKKILRNVFVEGDSYFDTGDLMRSVKVGFTYGQKHYQFVDRVGDTFRWKGENIATNEIGEIINQHAAVEFANVYGVTVPGTDGRAGMAALVLRDAADDSSDDTADDSSDNTADDSSDNSSDMTLVSLSQHIQDNLPHYARPLFIRLLKQLPTTSTHKLQKNDLREQAFHLAQVSDEVFVLRPGDTTYSRLDKDFYEQIMAQQVAF